MPMKEQTSSSSSHEPETVAAATTSLSARIVSGSVGAIITSFTVTPLEVLKIRQQQLVVAPNVSEKGSRKSNGLSSAVARQVIQRCSGCGTTVLMNNGLMDCVVEKQKIPYFNNAQSFKSANGFGGQNSNLSIMKLLRNIYKREGFQGIYAGLGPTLLMSVPNTVLYFTSYDEITHRIKRHNARFAADKGTFSLPSIPDWMIPLISGSTARLLATFTTSPLELIRTRQAAASTTVNNKKIYRSLIEEVRITVKSHGGIQSLWKGLAPTLWRDVPFSAIYWLGIEEIRFLLNEKNENTDEISSPLVVAWHSFVSGACAGMMAAFCTTPFDVVKTRIQSYEHDIPGKVLALQCNHNGGTALPDFSKRSTLEHLLHIHKIEGLSGLWRGNVTRMIKVAPACAIMISCYEVGKNVLVNS